MSRQTYHLGKFGDAGLNLHTVSLNAGELVALFCRAPVELKVYLALRAHAVEGEVSAPLHMLPRRLIAWLRYERDAGSQIHRFNLFGERDSSRYAEENELKVLRQVLKRLVQDGLIDLAERQSTDGRMESVCTFPAANAGLVGTGAPL